MKYLAAVTLGLLNGSLILVFVIASFSYTIAEPRTPGIGFFRFWGLAVAGIGICGAVTNIGLTRREASESVFAVLAWILIRAYLGLIAFLALLFLFGALKAPFVGILALWLLVPAFGTIAQARAAGVSGLIRSTGEVESRNS